MRILFLSIYLIPLILKSQIQLSFSIEGTAGFTEKFSSESELQYGDYQNSNWHSCSQIYDISRKLTYNSSFLKGFSPSFGLKIGNHKINMIWDPFLYTRKVTETTTKGYGTRDDDWYCYETRPNFQETSNFTNKRLDIYLLFSYSVYDLNKLFSLNFIPEFIRVSPSFNFGGRNSRKSFGAGINFNYTNLNDLVPYIGFLFQESYSRISFGISYYHTLGLSKKDFEDF